MHTLPMPFLFYHVHKNVNFTLHTFTLQKVRKTCKNICGIIRNTHHVRDAELVVRVQLKTLKIFPFRDLVAGTTLKHQSSPRQHLTVGDVTRDAFPRTTHSALSLSLPLLCTLAIVSHAFVNSESFTFPFHCSGILVVRVCIRVCLCVFVFVCVYSILCLVCASCRFGNCCVPYVCTFDRAQRTRCS